MEYGQNRHPKDVKNKPLDEFVTQTSNNMSQAAEETPVKPGAAVPDGIDEREIDKEGAELDKGADKKADEDNVPKMGT
ncbi:MAG: hypothetical protein J7621_03290 [Niastella sp.]|nr:hypothetical protein [Niastella sp.]